jgi:hypothetical protein
MYLIRRLTCVAGAFAIAALQPESAGGAAAFPTALYQTLAKADGIDGCAQAKHESALTAARAVFAVGVVHLKSGATVYTAQDADPCLSHAVNGPLLAFVASGSGGYRQVLSTGVVSGKFGADGSLVTMENDSAITEYRTTYRFDGSTYAVVSEEIVSKATGAAKKIDVSVHFAPGTSSATVSGNVTRGFGDSYVLDANAGQTMSVVVHPRAGNLVSLSIYHGSGADSETVAAGTSLSWRAKLPKSGRYEISVDDSGAAPAAYTMTIAIE